MIIDKIQFGDFIRVKRQKRKITLKALAERLDLSITYLGDIEKNKRYPINGKIDILIKVLELSPKEQALLNDLAGKARKGVSPDLLEYIMESEASPYIRKALRIAKQNTATVEDWKRVIAEFKAIRKSEIFTHK